MHVHVCACVHAHACAHVCGAAPNHPLPISTHPPPPRATGNPKHQNSITLELIEIISLHICSMWETICDAWACCSGWKFGPNSTEYPYSEIQNTPPPKMKIVRNLGTLTFQFQNTPPPPENRNLGRSWHFVNFQFQNTPPPKLKFRQILALCDFSVSEYPLSPRKLKFRQILALCDFSVSEYPPPPKIEI